MGESKDATTEVHPEVHSTEHLSIEMPDTAHQISQGGLFLLTLIHVCA